MPRVTRERVWNAAGMYPHEAQKEILASPARHRTACCGRRFGKSVLGGATLLEEIVLTRAMLPRLEELGRRREFWIVGPEYTDSEKEYRVLWDAVKRLEIPLDKPGSYYVAEGGPMVMSLFGGRFIAHAKSAKYPGTLVGEGLCGVVMAEAAKLKEIVWTKHVRPMLADAHLSFGRGWSLWLTTPEGKNWFWKLWMRAHSGARSWASFRMPSWRNSVVFGKGTTLEGVRYLQELLRADPGLVLSDEQVAASGVHPEIVEMLDEMSEELFKQEVEADFTEFAGRVFKGFDEEVHVVPFEYNPLWPLYGAVDYGWTNPFVWLDVQVDAYNNVYVLNEYYRTEMDAAECGQELLATGRANARRFYPDPAEPDDTHTLSKLLHVPAASNTGGELRTRLELIRNALKPAPAGWPTIRGGVLYINGPRLLIHPRCTNLIREMLDYRYPETRADAVKNPRDEPVDKDNHGPEALGRFFKGHFGKVQKGRSRSTQAQVVA